MICYEQLNGMKVQASLSGQFHGTITKTKNQVTVQAKFHRDEIQLLSHPMKFYLLLPPHHISKIDDIAQNLMP